MRKKYSSRPTGSPRASPTCSVASTAADELTSASDVLGKFHGIAAKVAEEPGEAWVIWCDTDYEADALTARIPGALEVRGSMSPDEKESRIEAFSSGSARILITKPSVCGFGLNWQHCSNMAFVGVTDSFESYYQAVRRCWRFGQASPVDVHIYASELEGAVLSNLKRKEADARAMSDALSAETMDAIRESVIGQKRTVNEYNASTQITIPTWLTTEQ